jgi:hypothetical protein
LTEGFPESCRPACVLNFQIVGNMLCDCGQAEQHDRERHTHQFASKEAELRECMEGSIAKPKEKSTGDSQWICRATDHQDHDRFERLFQAAPLELGSNGDHPILYCASPVMVLIEHVWPCAEFMRCRGFG